MEKVFQSPLEGYQYYQKYTGGGYEYYLFGNLNGVFYIKRVATTGDQEVKYSRFTTTLSNIWDVDNKQPQAGLNFRWFHKIKNK